MGRKTLGEGGDCRDEVASIVLRPPALRLRRDCGAGVWVFEQADGQLYIARKGEAFSTLPASLWPVDGEHPPFPPDTAA